VACTGAQHAKNIAADRAIVFKFFLLSLIVIIVRIFYCPFVVNLIITKVLKIFIGTVKRFPNYKTERMKFDCGTIMPCHVE
jgi:hypothetical protein